MQGKKVTKALKNKRKKIIHTRQWKDDKVNPKKDENQTNDDDHKRLKKININ